ncbi:MAG: SUMF1/EgtB/PvdO family nonheme iron enzyme, partial [Bacteroidota bacterium]
MKRILLTLIIITCFNVVFISTGYAQKRIKSIKNITINEALIPGGVFNMGDHYGFVDSLHPSDEVPLHDVKIDSFYMAVYLTTNQQFLDYLNSELQGGNIMVSGNKVYHTADTNIICYTHQYANYYSISYNGSTFSMADFRGNHPMVGVMWYGAISFCNWMSLQNGYQACYTLATGACDSTKNGYRLPTEAEWEYAGRGGQNNPYYKYPWGNDTTVTKANWPNSGDPYESADTNAYPFTTPVGFYDGSLRLKSVYNWPGA